MSPTATHRAAAAGAGVAAVVAPLFFSSFVQALAADALAVGIIVLSLVLLTGCVGQISFCQYSFAAVGAFTVGSLVGGHGWSFWLAAPLGVAAAGVVGVLVAIPALRLSGLFLSVLTVAVALFFDRFVLAAGTWDAFSGGLSPWRPARPSLPGIDLGGSYAFYAFALGAFAVCALVVRNLQAGKTGRVLGAIRDAELAAATVGVSVVAWKLAAFGTSAALAGLGGVLLAVSVGSVSAGSFDLLHSLGVAAVATVMGVGSVASAAAGGVFLVFGPELLRHTPVSAQWFNLIVGALLVAQLIATPEGIIPRLTRRAAAPAPAPAPGGATTGMAGVRR